MYKKNETEGVRVSKKAKRIVKKIADKQRKTMVEVWDLAVGLLK